MKRYNIVVPKKYIKNQEEKTSWKNVGTLVRFPATEEKEEGYIMELNMFPNVDFRVFEEKPKEEYQKPRERVVSYDAPQISEEIDPNDIPF